MEGLCWLAIICMPGVGRDVDSLAKKETVR